MVVSLKHKAQLYRQLYVGMRSGLPIEQLLMTEILPRAFASQARRLARNVQEGKPLSAALSAATVIVRWEEQLLAIGENSGQLVTVLRDLSEFFEIRYLQLASLKTKLVYPGLILLVAIFVQPLPRIAAGTLNPLLFVFQAGTKVLILYTLYKFLIVRPFEQASNAAFNPLLIRGLRYVDRQHWLRMMYEVSYLNLLTLCLESGLDAAQTLKLMRDGSDDADYRQRHELAIQAVEKTGMSLSQALASSSIICNTQVFSFLNSSEQSGSLHSDMRQFLIRKRAQTANNLKHFVKMLALWLYILVMGVVLAGFV